MKLNFLDKNKRIIVDAERCKMEKASYSNELSHIGLDTETLKFHATLNNVRFKKLSLLVRSVLEANAYSINLENMLACLDTMYLGIFTHSDDGDGDVNVKTYADCLQFQLPAKKNVGDILKLFYGEIEMYEKELLELRSAKIQKLSQRQQKDILHENDKLKAQNEDLKDRLAELTEHLDKTKELQQSALQALDDKQMLPPELKMGVVRSINYEDRTASIKTLKKNFVVPAMLFTSAPTVGAKCLIKVADDQPERVHVYENGGVTFETRTAKVMYIKEQRLKLRDDKRDIWVLKLHKQEIKNLLPKPKRGENLVCSYVNGNLFKIEVCPESKQEIYSDHVQDKITQHLLNFTQGESA